MEKNKLILLTFLFLFYAIVNILLNSQIPNLYIIILCFFLIKMVFDYHKCTLSYIECKLRNVKKEKGYINNFVEPIVNLRNEPESVFIYIFGFLIIYYHFIDKKNEINIL